MKITEMLLTPSNYTRQQTPIKVTKIAVHYVGNPSSTALANRNYFEGLSKSHKTRASSHYIIGLQGEIIRCIPENEQSIATNSANSYSLSIECCHFDITGKFNEFTYNSLVELCLDICKRYGLNPLVDIITHNMITGKICPKWFVDYPKEFDLFKKTVADKLKPIVAIDELDEALKYICAKSGIDYKTWYKSAKEVKWLDACFIKIARAWKDDK